MRSMTTHDSSRKGRRYTSSSIHLVDLLPLLDDAETTGQVIDRSRWIWSDIYDAMDPEDTLWVFAPNARKNSRYWPIAMAIADAAREDSGLALKNTITRYQDPKPGGDLSNAYEEVLFFVKDKRQYRFSKDEIRGSHTSTRERTGPKTVTADEALITTPRSDATIPTAGILEMSGSKRSATGRRTRPWTRHDRSLG
jgi:hypothetical protein